MLNILETEGIIEIVEKQTDGYVPKVSVLKRNGNVRICVGLKKLDETVKKSTIWDNIRPRDLSAQDDRITTWNRGSRGYRWL